MLSTEYVRGSTGFDGVTEDSTGDMVIQKVVEDGSIVALEKGVPSTGPYRIFLLTLQDGEVTNDGTDTETVTIEVVNGLEVARGPDPANATVLDYNGDVTLSVDSQQTTKTLTNGSVSFDLTTDKSAGSEIEVVAELLADYPAKSDSATIEVVSA